MTKPRAHKNKKRTRGAISSTEEEQDLGPRSRERSLSKRSRGERQEEREETQPKITDFTDNSQFNKGERIADRDSEVCDNNSCTMERMNTNIEKILAEIFEIRKENEYLKRKVQNLEKRNEELEDEVDILAKRLKEEKEKRNLLEQYTRKENIKIVNLPEDSKAETQHQTEDKVMNLFENVLKIENCKREHISIAHRIGKFREGQNRPVVVRFITRKVIAEVFRKKKILKEKKTRIYINEDLTQLNAKRLSELKKHPAVLSAWSFRGQLFCKLLNLEVIQVEDGDMSKIDRVLLHTPDPGRQDPQQSSSPHDTSRTNQISAVSRSGGSGPPSRERPRGFGRGRGIGVTGPDTRDSSRHPGGDGGHDRGGAGGHQGVSSSSKHATEGGTSVSVSDTNFSSPLGESSCRTAVWTKDKKVSSQFQDLDVSTFETGET